MNLLERLLNAGARYNRVAHDAEEQAGLVCKFYMDDTLGSSKTFKEHLQLLRRIFQSYRDHGLLIKLKKTKLFRQSVEFFESESLGGRAATYGGGNQEDHEVALPGEAQGKAAFLGFVQYYAQFLPTFSEL